jgi:hypothetical protein
MKLNEIELRLAICDRDAHAVARLMSKHFAERAILDYFNRHGARLRQRSDPRPAVYIRVAGNDYRYDPHGIYTLPAPFGRSSPDYFEIWTQG